MTLWIEAPQGVIDVLESWALVRHAPDPLSNDNRGVATLPDLQVQPLTVASSVVQLEGFPLLCEALARAICEWWAGDAHEDDALLLLHSKEGYCTPCPQVLLKPDEKPPPCRPNRAAMEETLRKILPRELQAQMAGRTTSIETDFALWETGDGDVRLRFIKSELIEVGEQLKPYGERPPTPRHRAERVRSIEQRSDGILIEVVTDDESAPQWGWRWVLPLPEA